MNQIQWLYLVAALVLLLPPMPFSLEIQKSFRSSQRRSLANPLAALGVWQNWVDLIRGGLGVYWLVYQAIRPSDIPEDGSDRIVVIAAILAVALLVQIVRGVRTVHLFGPVFYLSGLTLILGGQIQGAFALAVGWCFAIVGKNLGYQMPAMLFALATAGAVLGYDLLLWVGCGLILMPLVLSAFLRKRLLFAASSPAPA